MDELLKQWRELYSQKAVATYEIRARIADLQDNLLDIEEPFEVAMTKLEAEIRAAALSLGKTYRAAGVEVAYRKGATRVSYKWQDVDQVRNVLRDILPETAATLDAARSETTGEPSVTVKAV